MTRDEALRLALEALELVSIEFVCNGAHHAKKDRHEWLDPCPIVDRYKKAITAIKAALEAKDEKANDELRRLHDLLGKANALARIRANKIDELEQRLTKTEAQLGEAVWNYGELKREQLANQQKTSGSPINTSTALEAKDEPAPVAKNEGGRITWMIEDWPQNCLLYTHPPQSFTYEQVKAHIRAASMSANDISVGSDTTEDGVSIVIRRRDELLYAEFFAYSPPQRTWVGLTDEEVTWLCNTAKSHEQTWGMFVRAIEAKLKEKNT